jgi:hypothetical protein
MTTNYKSSLVCGIIFTIIVLLPLGYIGMYFAVLALPSTVRVPSFLTAHSTGIHAKYIEINGEWNSFPDYHGLPEWLFKPLHDLDRAQLRPDLWSGSHPRNQEMSFDWVIKK